MWCKRWSFSGWIEAMALPTTVHEVRSFHGLVLFHQHFLHNFCTIMVPITTSKKKKKKSWCRLRIACGLGNFHRMMRRLQHLNWSWRSWLLLLFLHYLIFLIPLLHCDASKVGIGVVLSQGGRPKTYLSEKLSALKLNYSSYNVEFYAVVQALKHGNSYLAYYKFILYSDHEVLKHLHSEDRLSFGHAGWVAYIQ